MECSDVQAVVAKALAVVQDVFQGIIEPVLIESVCNCRSTSASLGLASRKPPKAAIGKVGTKVHAVFQTWNNLPFPVKAAKHPGTFG